MNAKKLGEMWMMCVCVYVVGDGGDENEQNLGR